MKTFINIQWKISNFANYYTEAFLDIKEIYDTEIYNYYISWNILKEKVISLEKKWINMISYINEKDLFEKIKKIKCKEKIFFINTFTEQLIPITNKIKKELWQKITDKSELFRNKRLQRELLLKYDKKIATSYKKINIENICFLEIKKEFGLPFVIKPSNWIQSAWVSIIKNENEFNDYVWGFKNFLDNFSKNVKIEELEMIVEEFIDWDKYSVDYFVDENWKITWITKSVFNLSAEDIWIDDLFEFLLFVSIDKAKELEKYNLLDFLNDTIKATWIKNTFVHHEFKLTSSNQLKTIELNWRIWGYRLEMYNKSSKINLLSFMFEKKWEIEIKDDFAVIQFYSKKEWILEWFNENIIEKIKKLESFFSINIIKSNIWKKVWLTKKWYWKVIALRLKWKEIEKDLNFIEKNYNKLLIIK